MSRVSKLRKVALGASWFDGGLWPRVRFGYSRPSVDQLITLAMSLSTNERYLQAIEVAEHVWRI